MTLPLAVYRLEKSLSDVDLVSDDLVVTNPIWVSASALDIDYALLGEKNGDGFSIGYQFSGDGTVFGCFDLENEDGFLMGQHDGTNGVAVKIENGVLTLVCDQQTSVVEGVLGLTTLNLSLSWNSSACVLVRNGTIIAVIPSAPTLPASDFKFFGSALGGDGCNSRVSFLCYWNVFLGYQQPADLNIVSLDINEYGTSTLYDSEFSSVEVLANGENIEYEISNNKYIFTNTGATQDSLTQVFGTPVIDLSSGGLFISDNDLDSVKWDASDFTIEAWVYRDGDVEVSPNTGSPLLIGNMEVSGPNNYWSFGLNSSEAVRFFYYNGSVINVDGTTVIPTGVWTHIAMTHSAGVITLYVDGVQDATAAVSGTPLFDAGTGVSIGKHQNISAGHLADQIRMSKTLRYNTNFTVPENRFPNRGTGIGYGFGDHTYTFDGSITDIGSNPSTLNYSGTEVYTTGSLPDRQAIVFNDTSNAYGNIQTVDLFNPNKDFFLSLLVFVPSGQTFSIYDSFISTPYNSYHFNIFFAANADVNNPLLGINLNTGNNLDIGVHSSEPCPLDTWFYIAAQRSGDNLYLFKDGVLIQTVDVTGLTFDVSSSTYFGAHIWQNGYLKYYAEEFRFFAKDIVETPASGYDINTIFYSSSVKGEEVFLFNGDIDNSGDFISETSLTASGTPVYASGINGSNGLDMTAANYYVYSPSPTSLPSPNSDFFISVWANVTAVGNSSLIFGTGFNGSDLLNVMAATPNTSTKSLGLAIATSGQWDVTVASTDFDLNVWEHFALQRKGNTVTLFLNGQTVATKDVGDRVFPETWYLGYYPTTGGYTSGVYDEWRFFSDNIVSTSTFDPVNLFDEVASAPLEVGVGFQYQYLKSFSVFNRSPNSTATTGFIFGPYTEEFMAPTSWGVSYVDPEMSGSTYAPVPVSTPDVWDTKKPYIVGQRSWLDVGYGSYSFAGSKSNIKSNPTKGQITGTVVDEFNTPVSRLVRCYDRFSGNIVREQWSDSNGNYALYELHYTRLYTITAHDYTGTYNAVVKDNVSPTEM